MKSANILTGMPTFRTPLSIFVSAVHKTVFMDQEKSLTI